MVELKPCPFCNGDASVSYDPEGTKDTYGRHWAFTIVCNRCAASSGLCYSIQQAADMWNRRASHD